MTFRGFPAVIGLLAVMLAGPVQAQFMALPLDPRFTREPAIDRDLIERPIMEPYRWPPGDGRPIRCSIRREVVADYLPGFSNRRFEEPVAPLREYELGFERVGDPATSDRIEAFMRFRFERLSDGKPLHVERPLVDFDGGNGMTSDWPATPIDTEGFSGARIAVNDMQEAEFQRFFGKITAKLSVAMTLPERGEDRVYWLAFDVSTLERMQAHTVVRKKLADCMCAFGNDDISRALREYCGQE